MSSGAAEGFQQRFFNLIELDEDTTFTSKTNDQGVINLFFNGLHDYFKELKTGDEETSYYDFFERYGRKKEDYIMLKQVKT